MNLIIWTLVTFAGIFLFVVFTLIIINSGAYLTPPGDITGFAGTPGAPSQTLSPYIDVVKIASYPPDTQGQTLIFENSDLNQPQPITITYTITITAKLDTLENISYSYYCSVRKKGSTPTCPSWPPVVPVAPKHISPSKSEVIIYEVTYPPGTLYEDTLTTDTFTVTAKVSGQTHSQTNSASIKIGNPPEDCPSGWPVLPERFESSLGITQGPQSSDSHSFTEAIDIGASVGHTLTSRHSGIARAVFSNPDPAYGCYVDIESSCNGEQFISRYAHMDSITIQNGAAVAAGQVIGLSGGAKNSRCGGNTSGPHLHYEFRNANNSKLYPTDPPPYMEANYLWDGNIYDFIPKDVPRYCVGRNNCNTTIP